MGDRWRGLADRFYEAKRAQLGQALAAAGRAPASQQLLEHFIEAAYGDSGADAQDIAAFKDPSPSDVASLTALLEDRGRMHFLRVLADDADCCPPALVASMTRGAVYTGDLSFNRLWIERAITQSAATVRDTLLSFLESGTPGEIAGAAHAFYWFDCFNRRPHCANPVDPLRRRRRVACLTAFVGIDDLELRRCLASRISSNPDDYPPRVRPLLDQAREIVDSTDDQYIRDRFRDAR